MPKKKLQKSNHHLEFDSSKWIFDEEAQPSPLPSPVIGGEEGGEDNSSSSARKRPVPATGGAYRNDTGTGDSDDESGGLIGATTRSSAVIAHGDSIEGHRRSNGGDSQRDQNHHRKVSFSDFSDLHVSTRMREIISSKRGSLVQGQQQQHESSCDSEESDSEAIDGDRRNNVRVGDDDDDGDDTESDHPTATANDNEGGASSDRQTAGGAGAHHRMVSSSDFSIMQLSRMRDLLTPNNVSQSSGMEATIDENTPLVNVQSPQPQPPPPPLPPQEQQQQQPNHPSRLRPRWDRLGRSSSQHKILTDDAADNNEDDDEDMRSSFRSEDGGHSIISETKTKHSIFTTGSTILDGAKSIIADMEDLAAGAWVDYEEKCHYDWRDDWKSYSHNNKGGSVGFRQPLRFLRWLATGDATQNITTNSNKGSTSKADDDEIQENLNNLARLLSLLREYYDRFGMPSKGGPKDQEYVLREVIRDLYYGGAPIWALEPVMKKVAEGLTGKEGVEFFMLPRRAFIFAPSTGATSMFQINRGYDMHRLDAMESIAVKLASYASNTNSTSSIPGPINRWPKPQELRRAFRTEESVATGMKSSKEDLAEEILTLASESEGLFYFVNTHHPKRATTRAQSSTSESSSSRKYGDDLHKTLSFPSSSSELDDFWAVEDTIREVFSRLAAIDAMEAIDKNDIERKPLYSPLMIMLFRIGSSAGACAFWFNGSWADICVSGILAVLVAWIGNSPLLNRQERIIFEAVASLIVGLVSGIISIQWPSKTCFGAMAISGILDLFQGFRVVYSIIEIMSRHSVTGAADFLEGVFFTALIAYFLKFGQYVSVEIMGKPENDNYLQCVHGVDERWYLLFVPVAAISWSGLFNPHYIDLPIMAAHGILGYVISWQFQKATNSNFNNFIASMCVTFSSGIISRFTGRQALGNTVAGLYVLLPGAYLITTVYNDRLEGFLTSTILRAVIIGIGAWTGTLLCAPTLIGINRGLVDHQNNGMPSLLEGSNLQRSSSGFSSESADSGGTGRLRRRNRGARDRKSGLGGSLLKF